MVRETRQIDAFPAERSDLLHGRRANHYALRLVPGLALRFAEHRGQRAADNIDELFINRRRRREPEHPARAQGAQHPVCERDAAWLMERSEEHTSELQSLMRISYAVFCLKKKKTIHNKKITTSIRTYLIIDNTCKYASKSTHINTKT